VEEERLAEGGGVARQLGAGDGLEAELLAGSAEGGAVEEVVEALRQACDVEVALVEDDAAGEATVGVDADAEEQAAGVGLLDVDAQVLEGGVGGVVDDLDVGAVGVEDV